MARKTKKEQKFHEMEGTTEYPCEIMDNMDNGEVPFK